jgi:SAM-dependent methyltransferase
MHLWQVRRHWDELARADPFYAVLTESSKSGNRWALDEFFLTGISEVKGDLEGIRRIETAIRFHNALDFGCGAGRLTQALAGHCENVTGVDISPRMVALATEHCSNPRVRFLANSRSDLRIFPDGAFDLVYTRITLQHIAPRHTLAYLREFMRVLAPGGFFSLQIPQSVPPGDPPDRLRFSLWAPTMWMRIKRHVRYHHPGWFPATPRMQMYAIPRETVTDCLNCAGAQVLSVEQSEHGLVQNLIYLGRKSASLPGTQP